MLNGMCVAAQIPSAAAQGHYILKTQTLSGHFSKQNTLFAYLPEVRHIFEVLLEGKGLQLSLNNLIC